MARPAPVQRQSAPPMGARCSRLGGPPGSPAQGVNAVQQLITSSEKYVPVNTLDPTFGWRHFRGLWAPGSESCHPLEFLPGIPDSVTASPYSTPKPPALATAYRVAEQDWAFLQSSSREVSGRGLIRQGCHATTGNSSPGCQAQDRESSWAGMAARGRTRMLSSPSLRRNARPVIIHRPATPYPARP